MLKEELPGGDTFMHEGFKRVHITVPTFFVLHIETLLTSCWYTSELTMFYTSLQANEQIYHETYGGMCCVLFMLCICIDKTGVLVLFMTCSKPSERSIGEGALLCNPTFHFDYSPTSKCMIHGLLRSEKTSMIPDLTTAECRPNHSSQSCPSCTRRQQYPHFPAPFCRGALSPLYFVVPHPCSTNVVANESFVSV